MNPVNAVYIAAVVVAAVVIVAAWYRSHRCHICRAWSCESGPTALCPLHRARAASDLEREWARELRGHRA